MKRTYLILFFLEFCTAVLLAQGTDKMPRFTIRATCAIPKNITSELYRHSFGGVLDANVTFNYRLKSNMTCGLGYQSSLFTLQKYFKDKYVGDNWLATKLQCHGGMVRIGYDKNYSEGKKGYFSFILNTGYSYNQYTGVVCPSDSLKSLNPDNFQCAFFRPEINFNFFGEGVDNLAFSIMFAYNYNLYFYDPNLNCFSYYADSNFKKYSNKAGMSWLSVGFGFVYGIGKAK